MANNNNNNTWIKTTLGVIGGIILFVIGYAIWVNSHAFEGSFFGITIQMPLESTEHYCNRRAEGMFTFDTKEYQKCKKEASDKNVRHSSLVSYFLKTFTDPSDKKTAITTSQAECMASKFEAKLSDSQIDKFLKGTVVADMIGTQEAMKLMNDIVSCVK